MDSTLEKKLKLLAVLEQVFTDFVEEQFQVACERACSVCCTDVVAATTLEAERMLTALRDSGREDLQARLKEAAREGLFRPKITTNAMAMAIMTGQDPPVEEPGDSPGVCPFLENDLCAVYEARPFTCRGMFSQKKCQAGSEADPPDILATLVPVCWQIIEHIDSGGLYGNLIDLMQALSDPENEQAYRAGDNFKLRGTPPTKPVPGLLVPPEHQETVQAFLERLFQTDVDGRTFRQAVSELRSSPF